MNRYLPLAVVAGFALTAGSWAQDTAKKVTFRAPAAPAKNLFPELSKAAGVTFTTSPQTADEVLLVDVKEVPFEDLMKQIAKVAAAEWRPESDGYRLIRSQAMQNQQEREYYDARAALIKQKQTQLQQELSKQKPLTPESAREAAAQQQRQTEEVNGAIREGRPLQPIRFDSAAMSANPASRLMKKLVSMLNPGDLARMEANTRLVFSSFPTRAQRSLPSGANRAISDFVREHQIWLEAQPRWAADPTVTQFVSPFPAVRPMQGGLGKVLLVATRMMFGTDIQCELMVADAAGNIVGRQFQILSMNEAEAFRGATPETVAPSAAPTGEKPIELSASAREHAELIAQSPTRGADVFIMSAPAALPRGGAAAARVTQVNSIAIRADGAPSGGGSAARLPVSDAWRRAMNQPEKSEPLGFAVSELFMGLAAQHGTNLVASLPDQALVPLSARARQTFTPSQLLEIAKSSLELNVEEKDGWLSVMPKYPALARENRVDRDELGILLSGIQKEGRMSLDALARYANSRRNPVPTPGFDARYVSVLHPQSFNDFNQATFNWRMLQLYAQLTMGQRQHLSNNGTLSLGSLSPSQSNVVRSMVYDDQNGPMLMPDPTESGPREETRTSFVMRQGGQIMTYGGNGGKLTDERTEFLPNGVPTNGELKLTLSTEEGVVASRKDGGADPRYFTAESYGAYMGLAPNILIAGTNAPSMPQYDQFRPATMRTLDFQFQLSPRAYMTKQLRDSWSPPGARDVAFNGLPDEFRAKAEEAAKRMKDARGTIQIGGPQGGARPPA